MDTKLAVTAAVAGIVGILVGNLIAPSGPDSDEIAAALRGELAASQKTTAALSEQVAALKAAMDETAAGLSGQIAPQMSGLSESVAALDGKLAELEASTKGLAETAGQSAGEGLDALKEQIAAIAATVSDQADASATALKDQFDALRAAIGPAGGTEDAAPEAADDASASPAAPAPTAAAAADSAGLTAGQTALLADGALRVFVSRVDPEAQSARVAIQGKLMPLALGQPVLTMAGGEYCKVTLDGVSGSGAMLSGACGDDLPAAEGLGAGQTAILADGTIRVFVSRVEDWPARARLSVNGEMLSVALDRTALVTVGDQLCGIRLDGVDRGHASVSATCGDALAVAEPIAPGSAVSLGDGKARVFLSSVAGEDGPVRFSLAGTKGMHTLGNGESLTLEDGCALSVEGVAGGRAVFGYSCGN